MQDREPDFDCILSVLKREVPRRPTLFEFFMNNTFYSEYAKQPVPPKGGRLEYPIFQIEAFKNAGYDYTLTGGSAFEFKVGDNAREKTLSLNHGFVITNREEFDKYKWNNPDDYDYTWLDDIKPYLPNKMKLIISGPYGVLENAIRLVGYDNLCFMLYDDEELVQEIFKNIGERLVRHYELVACHDSVGACIEGDDWGFNSQMFFSYEHMNKYVFTWHKKIVEAIHKNKKPAILHSCGNIESAMEAVITEMKYDARHSFEDKIIPVEQAYDRWHDRIAILGGIDMDFLVRSSEEEISARCKSMLERTAKHGGYALGSGNSIPEYVPLDHYRAMARTALEG